MGLQVERGTGVASGVRGWLGDKVGEPTILNSGRAVVTTQGETRLCSENNWTGTFPRMKKDTAAFKTKWSSKIDKDGYFAGSMREYDQYNREGVALDARYETLSTDVALFTGMQATNPIMTTTHIREQPQRLDCQNGAISEGQV